ncbi:MAG TPA: hypothetical protein DDY14_10360 [Chromatiaceae bacterium]|jgi:glycosyltransferase involved in cell wall biosynthesis|nr:hypothetical protein [Chromatiaceae bacterium]HCS92829.1 hypothetical protein [Chromatiaceae bacterium]
MAQQSRYAVVSFDANSFMEPGSMMSREQILTRMARHNVVIHSTPPSGRHVPVPPSGLSKVGDNLYCYSNPSWLPRIYRWPAVDRFANRLRSLHRRNLIRSRAGNLPRVIYLWHPLFIDEVNRYQRSLLVYHIYDDYAGLPNAAAETARQERKALEQADLVFVANAQLLRDRQRTFDRPYIHLPQGVDFEAFERVRKGTRQPTPELENIRPPRIGYVGRLNDKVDLDLVLQLARARPNYSFVFIGPVEHRELGSRAETLAQCRNVHFLGPQDYGKVPSCLSQIDVAIVPYRQEPGQWAFYGSPLKLREALAAGKPVIASSISDVDAFGDLVRSARGVEDWLAQIDQALTEGTDRACVTAKIDYARRNSWDARVSLIDSLIREHLSQQT